MVYRKFILKNLKTNIRNHAPLLAGIIFSLAFIFSLMFLGTVIEESSTLWIAYNYGSLAASIHTFTAVGMISGLFLALNLTLLYMKDRLREYGLLLILGIRKKKMFLLLVAEYLSIWGITFIAGVLSGMALTAVAYIILKSAGFPVGEVSWGMDMCLVCAKTAALSLGYIACAVFYLLIRTANRDLSELANETAKPEKLKSRKSSIRTGILGICLIILSLTVRFTIAYWPVFLKQIVSKEILEFFSCIAGIYLLLSSGMSIVLAYMERNPERFVKHLVSARSMSFRVSAYRNIIFAVLLIHYTALYYVGGNIQIFADNNPQVYGWRYPHDLIGSMDWTEAREWEGVCRREDALQGMQMIPYTELQSETGMYFIGMAASEYERMTDESVALETGEILLCIQHDETDASNALADWSGEDSIPIRLEGAAKEFAIKKKDVKIFSIGDLGVGRANVNGIVFADKDYEKIAGEMGKSRILLLQDMEEGKQDVILDKQEQFRKGHPEALLLTRKEALNTEKLVDEISSAIYGFCGILLVIVGLSMLSIRFFSEIPDLEKKYRFLSDIGMTEIGMRREIGKEVRQLVWIPAVFGIFMAVICHLEILAVFLLQNSKYHFFAEGGGFRFAWEQCREWICVVAVFCLIQAVYGAYLARAVRKRVWEKEYGEIF